MPLLFSYGTLRYKQVQLDTFGRELRGTEERLHGFVLKQLEITDEKVLRSSQQQWHPIAMRSDKLEDFIDGHAFEITREELLQADSYEVSDYHRVEVSLESGRKAWIYIG